MESLLQEYITHSLDLENDLNVEEEVLLLHRRLSPYATLRPGDLATLLRLHAQLPACLTTKPGHGRSHHNLVSDSQSPPRSQSNLEGQDFFGLTTTADDGDGDDDSGRRDDVIDVTCRGADCNHVPAEYLVSGLRQHEMPVIGVYVDNRICHGFNYRVRRIGRNDFLFENEAKTLESIGMGYGRRLTFKSDSPNHNDCFFWSDSEPAGYAFSIHAVEIHQRLSVLDPEGMVVGEAVVENVDETQRELSMRVDPEGTVTKRVQLRMDCALKYHQRHHHGLVELMPAESVESIAGDAVLSKRKGSRKASLVTIDNVCLPRFGRCKLLPDA